MRRKSPREYPPGQAAKLPVIPQDEIELPPDEPNSNTHYSDPSFQSGNTTPIEPDTTSTLPGESRYQYPSWT